MDQQFSAYRGLTQNKPSDSSSAIAEKLLLGWALLDIHCPQCLTPLVRNRGQRLYCVGCSQWVVTEKAAAETLEKSVDKSQHPKNVAVLSEPLVQHRDIGNAWQGKTVPPPVQQVQTENRTEEVRGCRSIESLELTNKTLQSHVLCNPNIEFQAGSNDAMRSDHGSLSHAELSNRKSLVNFQVALPSNTSDVLSRTLSTLVQKIEEMSKLVAGAHEPLVIKQYLELIEHCIRIVQQITTLSGR